MQCCRRLELVTKVNIYIISFCILVKRMSSQPLVQITVPVIRVKYSSSMFLRIIDTLVSKFNIFRTVHLRIILVGNQHDTQFLL